MSGMPAPLAREPGPGALSGVSLFHHRQQDGCMYRPALAATMHAVVRGMGDALLHHIGCRWFGLEDSYLGWIKVEDALRAQLVQFRCGPTG